ncbi:MAG: lactonase family protein [Bacteroidales bacterium]
MRTVGTGTFVANYGSGNLAYFRLGEDGPPAGPLQVLSSDGTGPVSGRQEGPHTHQVLLDPESRYLLVPDLGSDRIRSYVYEERLGTLEPNPAQPFLALPPGSGPRHLVFHPGGTFLYIASELSSTVTACRYDASTGRMNILQELSTVEDTHRGTKYPAAIRISPDGRFVYVSTRGAEQNCVSVFEADPENGTLTPVQYLNDIPAWPRDFNLTPSGSHLLVAGERGNQIAAFAVDSVSGRLAPVGKPMALPAPGCILFDE